MPKQWLRTSMHHRSPSLLAANSTRRWESPLGQQGKASRKR